MRDFLRENSWPATMSVLLHGLVATGLLLMTYLSNRQRLPEVRPMPIDGVIVDAQMLHAAQRSLAERADAEKKALAAAARAAEEARENIARQSAADAEAAAETRADTAEPAPAAQAVTEEHERAAAAQRSADEEKTAAARAVDDARRAADAKTALAAEQAAAAEAQRAAEAQQAAAAKKAADAKLAADAKRVANERARQEREAELQRQLADEEHTSAVESGPLRDRYIALLQNSIQHAWIKPPSARVGVDCMVEVTQVPGGAVTGARVTQCNGDAAVRQSIENAVYRASPLPDPPDPALFTRNFVFRFRPND